MSRGPDDPRTERAADFDGWRDRARALLAAGVPPERVTWLDGAGAGGACTADLFGDADDVGPAVPGTPGRGPRVATGVTPPVATGAIPHGAARATSSPAVRLPAPLLEHLRTVACCADADRWALMYRFVWRRAHDRPALEDDAADPDVLRLARMAAAVRREVHRMHAFVRFVPCDDAGRTRWVAWFEPAHHVLERAAPFFVDRFGSLDWTIVTPRGALRWHGGALRVEPSPPSPPSPPEHAAAVAADDGATLWRTYYRSIFNRARVNPAKLARDLPVRYRAHLTEATEIAPLLAAAPRELARTMDAPPATPRRRTRRERAAADLAARSDASARGRDAEPPTTLGDDDRGAAHPSRGPDAAMPATPAPDGFPFPRSDAPMPPRGPDAAPGVPGAAPADLDACRRCDLWRDATHGVPGEGAPDAALMLVGEQPGDVEDRAARPFVGPAGRLLDEVMAAAGVDRAGVWMTNAVKHFKWEPRGTRRIHKTPAQREVAACRAWLEHEIATVAPRAIVALGATAARGLLGPGTTVDAARRAGPARLGDAWVVVTWHPSALLRAPDPDTRARLEAGLRDDLALAARLAAGKPPPTRAAD